MTSKSYRSDLLLLFLAIGIFFCVGLGARPYLTPSEARYIELPRQMLDTHDWLTPRINSVPYFEKPPLFYWMQASVMGLFGMGEFAGRFATALCSTLVCLTTYATARLLFSRTSGLLASAVLATSLLGYGLSRVATLDVPVSLFITLTLSCFLAGMHTGNRKFYLLMYAASALAMMTKGLIGIVVPGMVIGIWMALTHNWRLLKNVELAKGTLIFLLIAAPWHLLMARAHPDFLNFYFIHEHFNRYMTDEHKRSAPWWFFIAVTLAGLLPWVGLLPGALRRMSRKNPTQLFLLLWIALPLIFFSSSHSKLVPYIFPIFPPLAMLLGDKLALFWDKTKPVKSLRVDALLSVILWSAAIFAIECLPGMPGKLGQKISAVTMHIPMVALYPLILAVLWVAISIVRSSPKRLIISLMGLGITTGLTANYLTAALDTATIRPLADMLRPQLEAGDFVVAYGSYWQDLPVYLDRNITVAGWTGELTYGTEHYPETHHRMITTDEFWKRCADEIDHVYVFVREDTARTLPDPEECHLQPIATYGKTLLLQRIKP